MGERINRHAACWRRGYWSTKGQREKVGDLDRFLWYGKMMWSSEEDWKVWQKEFTIKGTGEDQDIHFWGAWSKEMNRWEKENNMTCLCIKRAPGNRRSKDDYKWVCYSLLHLRLGKNRWNQLWGPHTFFEEPLGSSWPKCLNSSIVEYIQMESRDGEHSSNLCFPISNTDNVWSSQTQLLLSKYVCVQTYICMSATGKSIC